MPRKPRKTKIMKPPFSRKLLAFFLGKELKDDVSDPLDDGDFSFMQGSEEKMLVAWVLYRNQVMDRWILENPCTRPWPWWDFDAVKEVIPDRGHEHWHVAQRLRLGGTGTPSHAVLAVWGGFTKGIPCSWVDQSQVDYYNGRRKDIHGKVIPTKYKEGDFEGVAIDPNDPPVFESETTYLLRLELLTAAEKIYLKKHPELLEPERVKPDEDDLNASNEAIR